MWLVMIRRQHHRAMTGTLDNLERAVTRARASG
jgi:hypothetical protein